MNGGYIMIYKNSKKIYLELFACLTLGKPILWYEDKNTCFFIDTISGGEITTEIVDDEEVRTYGDIILTKGGMTITITAENVVTEVGDIQPIIPEVKELYQHNIRLSYRFNDTLFWTISLNIVSSKSTSYTIAELIDYIGVNKYISVSGVRNINGEPYIVCGLLKSSPNVPNWQMYAMSTTGTRIFGTGPINLNDASILDDVRDV